MMSGGIKQCRFCNKPFQSFGNNICAECAKNIDEAFITVREYLYEAKGDVGISEIAEKTEVSEKMVLHLVKEGYLSLGEAATGARIKLSCDICGAPITKGRICEKCSNDLNKAIGSGPKKEEEKKPMVSKRNARMHVDIKKNREQ